MHTLCSSGNICQGNLKLHSSLHPFLVFMLFSWIKVTWVSSECPVNLWRAAVTVLLLKLLTFFPPLSTSFCCNYVKNDRSQRGEVFTSQWDRETLTSTVFKLSHKSAALEQIEQNGTFQTSYWSSMSALGTKGALATERLKGCIILPGPKAHFTPTATCY